MIEKIRKRFRTCLAHQEKLFDVKKTGGEKSRDAVPLTLHPNFPREAEERSTCCSIKPYCRKFSMKLFSNKYLSLTNCLLNLYVPHCVLPKNDVLGAFQILNSKIDF
jgi:hypothetical protein